MRASPSACLFRDRGRSGDEEARAFHGLDPILPDGGYGVRPLKLRDSADDLSVVRD